MIAILAALPIVAIIVWVNVWSYHHPMTPEERADLEEEMQIW